MLFRRNAALRAAAAVGASAAVTALVWALFGPPSSAAGDPQAAADAGPTPSAEVVTMVPAVVHPSSVAPALQPTSTDALATAEPHAKGPKLAHHTPAAAPSASHTAEITTTATPPPPPPFDLATARVDVGAATDLVGTTSANITRALGGLPAKATSCYRQALPSASAPLEGPAKLTLETDEDGVIVRARVSGVAPGARCVEAAAAGRRVSNVDTGRARATVPLVFRAR